MYNIPTRTIKHMYIRKTFAGLCASLLVATLIGFGLSWSIWHVISQPDYIKQTLRDSGIYESVIQDVAKQKAGEITSAARIGSGQAGFEDAISTGIPPTLIQEQTEKIIDSGFGWFQGKQDTLEASFDLGGAKQQIGNSVASYTEKHLRSLPACTPTEAARLTPDTDPLQAACLPAGFDIAAAANEARAKIVGSEALNAPALDANQIEAGEGKSLQQQLSSGPQVYERIQWAVYGQGILAILLAIGVMALAPGWRTGIRKLGTIALWTGVVSAVVAWVSGVAVQYAINKLSANTATIQVLQQKIIGIAQVVITDVRMLWLYYGLVLVAFGIVMLVIYRLTRPSPAKLAASVAEEKTIVTTPPIEPPLRSPTSNMPASLHSRPPAPKKPRRIQ